MKKVMLLTLCLVFVLSSLALAQNITMTGKAYIWGVLPASGGTVTPVEQDYVTPFPALVNQAIGFCGDFSVQSTVPNAWARYNCRVLAEWKFPGPWLNVRFLGKSAAFNAAVGAGSCTIPVLPSPIILN
jgi:hypothetical protein